MNSLSLLSLLETVGKSNSFDILFTGVTLNLQTATLDDICFYNLQEEHGIELFKKRLDISKASIIIIPNDLCSTKDDDRIINVSQEEFYKLQEVICDALYPLVKDINLVGVTGTNGKTTVVFLAAQIAQKAGAPAASIGTLGLCDGFAKVLRTHKTTTPSYIDFREELYWVEQNTNIKTLFIEMSSHALEQNRILNFKLSAAGWTNITQDHLDYHKTFENYLTAKLKITNLLKETSQLVISRNSKLASLLVGQEKKVANYLDPKKVLLSGDFFHLEHNIENLELAISIVCNIGIRVEKINTLELITPPGRLDKVAYTKGNIYIDFAHTPDALDNVCSALKRSFPEKQLTVIFGCGGDRDQAKRPLMGKAVSAWADNIVVTSDNPRSENPELIIDAIVTGISKTYKRYADRSEAIISVLQVIEKNDIVLIAGKGHEDYQEIQGQRIPYSDYNVINEFRKKYDI